MEKDYLAEEAAWLDGNMTNPANADLFKDERQSAIQRELAGRWVSENRLGLLNDLAARFGQEQVLMVIDAIIEANTRSYWQGVGREGGNPLARFIELLWGPLAGMGFEYTSQISGNQTKFCVTKCPVHHAAKEAGAEAWFYHLICMTDGPAATGFNDRVVFSRTRTLMQGGPDCDHCYTDLSAD